MLLAVLGDGVTEKPPFYTNTKSSEDGSQREIFDVENSEEVKNSRV